MPYANVNGVKLYYNIYGNGEPVILIHGVAITSRVWDYQKEELSKNFKMIVYDLRGSGKSQKTPEVIHTAGLLGEDLKGLVAHLGLDRVNIVGLSMGAAVAMKFAIENPEKVSKLILSGAFADLVGPLNFIRKYFGGLIGKALMTRFFGGLATKLMLPSSSREELLYYHKNIISIDEDEVRKYRQILGSYSITPALGRIASPTLIMYGEHEPLLHKYGKIIKDNIKDSKMIVVPGVGHGWNGEEPGLFSNIVTEFIRKGSIYESDIKFKF